MAHERREQRQLRHDVSAFAIPAERRRHGEGVSEVAEPQTDVVDAGRKIEVVPFF